MEQAVPETPAGDELRRRPPPPGREAEERGG